MGVEKNKGLGFGTLFFFCAWLISGTIFGTYVYYRTRDRKMAKDNAM